MTSPPAKSYSAVFLDRDGVINEEAGIIFQPDQLELIPGSAAGVRRLNGLGIPVIVVTNQPAVARGLCTEADIGRIHDRLKELLKEEEAVVDAVYFCPHHENADDVRYRCVCECRKPRAGLLRRAASEFGLDLTRCVVIGDRTVDLQAARTAGCEAFLVETGYGGSDGKCAAVPDRTFSSLAEAALFIEQCQTPENEP